MAKKNNKKEVVVAKNELSESELQKLAHAGTIEAIEKIEKYIEIEKDLEKSAYAEMALEECEMFYYHPTNEKEEEDFMLCELIRRKEDDIVDKMMKLEKLELIMEKSELERKVHEKVLKKYKDKKEEWKYNWLPDYVLWEGNRLGEIKEEISYDEAWVNEAKKMITVDRYKDIPVSYLSHFDFGFEEEFYEDDCDCGDNFKCGDDYFSKPPF